MFIVLFQLSRPVSTDDTARDTTHEQTVHRRRHSKKLNNNNNNNNPDVITNERRLFHVSSSLYVHIMETDTKKLINTSLLNKYSKYIVISLSLSSSPLYLFNQKHTNTICLICFLLCTCMGSHTLIYFALVPVTSPGCRMSRREGGRLHNLG